MQRVALGIKGCYLAEFKDAESAHVVFGCDETLEFVLVSPLCLSTSQAPFSLLHTLSGPKAKVTALVTANGGATAGREGPRLISGDYGGGFCMWDLGESPADVAPPLIATWQDQMDWRYSGVMSLAAAGAAVTPDAAEAVARVGGDTAGSGGSSTDDRRAMAGGNRHGGDITLYSGGGDRTVKAWRPDGRVRRARLTGDQ